MPVTSKYWAILNRPSQSFICCDAVKMPFPTNYFDIVYSLGVIEHIGTTDGHQNLAANYQSIREHFAKELLRVTKENGGIIISCPNKSFPIDIQHGPISSGAGKFTKLRQLVWDRFRLNIHRTRGDYHLLSYGEIKTLFGDLGMARSIRPLPLKNFFAFSSVQSGFLKKMGKIISW
jgi:SAM-dependent methyltransferase